MAERTIAYRFTGDFRSLTSGLTSAGRGVQDFSGRLTALDRDGERMRAGLTDLGNTAGRVGLAAAAGLGAIVGTAAKFDKAMSAVAATGDDAKNSLDGLRQAAIDAGAQTAFSASEAADGIEQLLKAGVSSADVLGGGLAGALDLAAAGALEVGDAAETAATAMTQFKLSGDQIPHLADLLSAGAGKAQGDVADLSMALKQGGLVAAQMGLSIEETTGTLAAFASAGLLGSDAGTSFKTLLLSLANPSTAAAATIKNLGIETYNAQGTFVGMASIAEQLKVALQNKSQAERDSALATIFGSDAIRAASVLYQQGGEGIKTWTSNVDDAGYAAETAATRLDNLAGDFEAFKGSLETAFIGAGEGAQSPLRGLTQKATEAVNVFNGLPPLIQSSVTGLLAITAITGGAAFFGTRVVAGIAATNTALASLGVTARVTATSLATTGASIGAIGVASVGFASDALSVVDSFNRMRESGKAAGDSLEVVTSNLTESNLGKYADDLGININKLAQDLVENGKSGEYVTQVMDQLSDSGHGVGAMFGSYLGNVVPFYTAEADKASSASTGLRDVIDGMAHPTLTASDALSAFGLTADVLAGATDDAGLAALGFSVSERQAGSAAEAAAGLVEEMTKAMRDQRTEALSAFDAVTGYRQALRDAREAAEKTSAGIRGNSDEVLNNRQKLSSLAAAWNNQSDAVKDAKGSFSAAKGAFIETATAMGVPKKAAQELAARLLEIPPSRVTNVTANTGQAMTAVSRLQTAVAALRDKTITITQATRLITLGVTGGGKRKGSADGGMVPKGGVYADRYDYRLAPGEEIISNRHGQADQFRADRAAGRIPGYGDGGTVGKKPNAKRAASAAQARRKANNALDDLGINLNIDADGASHAMEKFGDDLDNLRGLFHDAHLRFNDGLKKSTQALSDNAKRYDALNSALATARSDRAGFASEAGSSLGGSLFGNGLAGFQAAADANTADYRAANSGLAAAIANGLDGPLRDALATSGDINALTQFGSLNAAQIQAEETRYMALQAAQSAFGNTAASARYDAQINDLVRQTKQQTQVIERLEKRLPDAVERGAERGTDSGSRRGTQQGQSAAAILGSAAVTQGARLTNRGGGHRKRGGK